MNILFLTILGLKNINERGLYADFLRTFKDHGHKVFVCCPIERRNKEKTCLKKESSINILRVKTLNFQKTNSVEKGLATVLLEYQFYNAIKRYYKDVKFDLVIYSTPPITFTKVISYIKNRDNAFSYLLLKDIFPQNAVDLGMLKPNGMLHQYFREKEKKLYAISDCIGCMSPANVKFVLANNPDLDPEKVEINPNSIIPMKTWNDRSENNKIRVKYNIPSHKTLFIYGGNLGKPQGVDFLIDVLSANLNNEDAFFLIAGSGTDQHLLQQWFDKSNPKNVLLLKELPKEEYDLLLQASDVGLVFLDRRFSIPNFPSRLLSYLECKIPVLAATDVNSDLGYIAESNNFGLWCESGDLDTFNVHLRKLTNNPELIEKMGVNGYEYLMENYTSEKSYEIVMNHVDNK